MSSADRTVPLLVSVAELEALVQSVAVMLGALEAEQASPAMVGPRFARVPATPSTETRQAIATLRELERHLTTTLEGARKS